MAVRTATRGTLLAMLVALAACYRPPPWMRGLTWVGTLELAGGERLTYLITEVDDDWFGRVRITDPAGTYEREIADGVLVKGHYSGYFVDRRGRHRDVDLKHLADGGWGRGSWVDAADAINDAELRFVREDAPGADGPRE
jgi:hypothetical protein